MKKGISKEKYNVAILGATGVVGREMIDILEKRQFPIGELRLFASEKSVGEEISFCGKSIKVRLASEKEFQGIDFIMGDTPTEISKKFIPMAVKQGAVAIDCSSAYRMDPKVPLVIPEVNASAMANHEGIIAGPNCSAIPIAVAAKPIDARYGIKRMVIATYQSASGAGKGGMDELADQTRSLFSQQEIIQKVFPHRLAFNVIPQIDSFLPNGMTKEEFKIMEELRKILDSPRLGLAVTAVRVPVFCGHSAAVAIETKEPIDPEEVKKLLQESPGIILKDNLQTKEYPLPAEVAGTDAVYVGRVRRDDSVPNGILLWVVADNLRKGASLNAVQIAEVLIQQHRLD
ncbi:MAG: aspartate-semialdehyde dehydrogenase [Deltaproteobacteria bacterium]|nr:aspartate-semialdehyde dehydrogenase [Deltaproteobacteria bacterium]